MTIRQKTLLWFLIPSVLIATSTALFCYFYTRKVVERNIFDQLEIAAGKLQVNVRVLLEAKKGRVIDFSSDGFIRDFTGVITGRTDSFQFYVERLNNHLVENKKPLDPDILEIFIIDLEGEVIVSTENNHIGKDFSGDACFSKTLKRGSCVSDLHYSPVFGQNAFMVSRLLLSKKTREPIGIIANRYSGNALNKIAFSGISEEIGGEERRKGLGETGEIYIVNNDRLMITESRFVADAVLKQVVDTEGVRYVFDNGVGKTGIYTDYRGVLILGVSKYFEEMDWVILAEKDVSEAFAPVVWLRNFFIIIGASGILIMVVISILISTGITKSIKKLIRGTKRITGGDLEQPIKINEMEGEIKELGDSFNVMMQELSKSTRENRELFLLVKKGRDEWRKTFDAIADIITIHDENHKIIMANRAFFEKFEIDKDELPGNICFELFYGWQNCPLERSIKSSKPASEVVDDPHMGGIFLKSTYPMKDEKGEIYAYVHLARDITMQKELQAELIEKARELEKANKEMEDFVYLTSHDLKEPLFVIGGFTSRLSMAYGDVLDDKGRRFLRRIKANTEKMNHRIHEIMEVLKAGKIEYNFKENDSDTLVKDVIGTLQEKILENKITLTVQDNLPAIFCDDVRIKDVFLNLLTNSIKYMGNGNLPESPLHPHSTNPPLSHLNKGGQRGIRVGFINGGCGEIKIDCKKNGEYYEFCIEDTGIGIQADYQKQIFKIFKRLNDIDVEGTGIGLSIVKKIVERHKGNIWVESPVRDGKGSRFCFTIPLKRDILEHHG
jgi:signal transduction histidine kinase/HAMP domain-containing protein